VHLQSIVALQHFIVSLRALQEKGMAAISFED